MLNLGGGEILVILMIALLVLGPSRLPGAGRQIGRALAEFRRMSSGVQDDLREAMNVEGVRETVTQVREALDVPRAFRSEVVSAISAVGSTSVGATSQPANSAIGDLVASNESDGRSAASDRLGSAVRSSTSAPLNPLHDSAIPSPDGVFEGDLISRPFGVDVPAPSGSMIDEFGPAQ